MSVAVEASRAVSRSVIKSVSVCRLWFRLGSFTPLLYALNNTHLPHLTKSSVLLSGRADAGLAGVYRRQGLEEGRKGPKLNIS